MSICERLTVSTQYQAATYIHSRIVVLHMEPPRLLVPQSAFFFYFLVWDTFGWQICACYIIPHICIRRCSTSTFNCHMYILSLLLQFHDFNSVSTKILHNNSWYQGFWACSFQMPFLGKLCTPSSCSVIYYIKYPKLQRISTKKTVKMLKVMKKFWVSTRNIPSKEHVYQFMFLDPFHFISAPL